MSPREAADILRRYALALDLLNVEPFRARTFDNAARMLENQSDSVERLLDENRLGQIKGIGKAVETALAELTQTGWLAILDEAERQIPPGVFDLLRVQGLGVKKAHVLWKQAGITSLDQLEKAIRENTLPSLPGIGTKTFDKFLQSIEFLHETVGRFHRHFATREMLSLRNLLEKIAGARSIYLGGSLRRGLETVGDLDVVVGAHRDAVESVKEQISLLSEITWSRTNSEPWQGMTPAGMPLELSVVPTENLCARLLLFTGSKTHYSALCKIASEKGFHLDYDSLTDSNGNRVTLRNEQDIYHALGLEPVPPALRETADTLVPAGSKKFPKPVALREFRGIIHNHSTYSDGLNTVREMAEAMIAKQYEYLGIADHSKAAQYAGGLYPDRVREQWDEIDGLNRELAPFRILKGTEVDILADGKLDFEDELLAGFDYVVASIHSKFQMTEEEATDRLCHALENPHVDILGHMTGRLLLQRKGYPVDHERVIQCASEQGKAIELNCNPYRLDIDWRWLARCEELGVPVPINPDAHSLSELNYVCYGVQVAAKGPLTTANCPNTWTADELLAWCQTRKRPQ